MSDSQLPFITFLSILGEGIMLPIIVKLICKIFYYYQQTIKIQKNIINNSNQLLSDFTSFFQKYGSTFYYSGGLGKGAIHLERMKNGGHRICIRRSKKTNWRWIGLWGCPGHLENPHLLCDFWRLYSFYCFHK